MQFSNQVQLSSLVSNIGLQASPAAVQYGNNLYVFYNGVGNDGIFYTSFNGQNWSSVVNIASQVSGIGIMKNTAPWAEVYGALLYVFYNGSGNDGTYYVTFDGTTWASPVSLRSLIGSMSFASQSSPSAAAYQDLYLFWTGSDNSLYCSVNTRGFWTGALDLHIPLPNTGVASNSSTSAVEYMADTYLFYTGINADGIFYIVNNYQGWSGPVSVPGGIGIANNTYPSVNISGGDYKLLLAWAGSGNNGIFAATYDGLNGNVWSAQSQVACPNATPGILAGTSPCVSLYNQTPYLFWNGSGNNGIWFCTVETDSSN
jgi:hypothetical protein